MGWFHFCYFSCFCFNLGFVFAFLFFEDIFCSSSPEKTIHHILEMVWFYFVIFFPINEHWMIEASIHEDWLEDGTYKVFGTESTCLRPICRGRIGGPHFLFHNSSCRCRHLNSEFDESFAQSISIMFSDLFKCWLSYFEDILCSLSPKKPFAIFLKYIKFSIL